MPTFMPLPALICFNFEQVLKSGSFKGLTWFLNIILALLTFCLSI
jgi:hypothetical protein